MVLFDGNAFLLSVKSSKVFSQFQIFTLEKAKRAGNTAFFVDRWDECAIMNKILFHHTMPNTFNEQQFSEQLEAIKTAAQNGELNTLQELHTQLMAQHSGFIENPNARELLQTQPIAEAAAGNHIDCVRFLLPWSDLQGSWNRALHSAVEHGHSECVKLLLPHSCEKSISEALVESAYHQQWKCADIIFDSLDTQFFHEDLCTTLLWASEYQQFDFLHRLYPVCDIDHVLEYARGRWDEHELLALTEYHTSVQQNARLSAEVSSTCVGYRRKSKM